MDNWTSHNIDFFLPGSKGRAAVEGASSIYKFDHHNINGGAIDNT
jgi:hypothetical protein